MSHYKPYPKYKDSGVEWIGEVPEHWRIAPLKALAQVVNGATPESGNPAYWDGDIAWFTPADLDNENATELVEPRRRITAEGLASCAARLTPAGSVVLSTRAPVGSVGVTLIPSATNQGCRTLVPKPRMSPKLLAETLVAARSELALRSNGTTFQELSTDSLASLRVPHAHPAEQTAIAAALDRETSRIDALIAKKTRFIELLKEKRQALITHAVTKGLDPNVKMKDSGVEWIGEVPEHWTITKLKHVSRALIGLTYAPEDVVDNGAGITVLRSSNIQGGQLDMADIVQVRKVVDSELMVKVGDILICSRNGSRALVGKNIQLDERSLGCTFGAFMTVVRGNFNDYLYFVFNSTMFDANSALYMTSTVNQLTISMIANMEAPFPPEAEQQAIVSHLRKRLLSLDTLLSKTQHSIDLLKERRSAFITAAMTGQIDLRGEA